MEKTYMVQYPNYLVSESDPDYAKRALRFFSSANVDFEEEFDEFIELLKSEGIEFIVSKGIKRELGD